MPEIPFITSGASAAELNVNRRNTTAFIAANPSLISLTPRTRVVGGDGTFWLEGELRPAQVGRLIDTQAVGGIATGVVATQDGSQDRKAFQLLLPYDGEIAVDDTFSLNGLRHEVTEVLVNNGYELRASVVRYG